MSEPWSLVETFRGAGCGTCKFALRFDYPDSPGGPEDGVHCASPVVVTEQIEEGWPESKAELVAQFEADGYMLLWRFELVADPDAECIGWEPKEVT